MGHQHLTNCSWKLLTDSWSSTGDKYCLAKQVMEMILRMWDILLANDLQWITYSLFPQTLWKRLPGGSLFFTEAKHQCSHILPLLRGVAPRLCLSDVLRSEPGVLVSYGGTIFSLWETVDTNHKCLSPGKYLLTLLLVHFFLIT